VETSSGSERSSWFRNAARALFSSSLLSLSRLSFLPFVSRPADILAGRFPTRAARYLLRISSRRGSHPREDLSIRCDAMDGGRRCRDLSYMSEANGPTSSFPQYVRKIHKSSQRGDGDFLGISHINRKSSRICASCDLHVLSSVNYHYYYYYFVWISIREC